MVHAQPCARNYISIPVPCDLKPNSEPNLAHGLRKDSTYSRQIFREISEIKGKEDAWKAPKRAFQRLSLIFPKSDVETGWCSTRALLANSHTDITIVIVLAFPMWKRLAENLSDDPKWPVANHVVDSYGYGFSTPWVLEHVPSSLQAENRGNWAEAQWNRVSPFVQFLASSHQAPLDSAALKERSLLWLYSKMNHNYFLACQNEARCWRDIRAILDKSHAGPTASQRPKRLFRDSMTKTTELLEIARDWLDRTIGTATDTDALKQLQLNAEITLGYEKSRIGQVLLNISDYQAEVEMELMVSQLQENRFAIEQAMKVGHLTKLAFIFVPLGTVCSAFGMNLREMDTHPTIWWFVGISVLCTIFAVIMSSSITKSAMRKFTGSGAHERERQ
jgi:hypothetical protein